MMCHLNKEEMSLSKNSRRHPNRGGVMAIIAKYFRVESFLQAMVLMAFLGFYSPQSLAATGTGQTSGIVDVVAAHHFIWIGNIFTDGHSKFLCVETEAHEYGLWSPLDDHLSATIPEARREAASNDEKCAHPGLHWVGTDQEVNHMGVNTLTSGGVAPNDTSHSNFSGGATLSLISDGYSSRCGLNLANYFTLTRRDGTNDSFYIVVRFTRPQLYVAEHCDDSEADKQELVQEFGSIWNLESVDLGDGRTLLFSYAKPAMSPVILILKTLPASVWSDGNVFIVPKDFLRPHLINDGWKIGELAVRYDALMKVIGQYK
jgi:hypothetical protein